MRNFFKQNKRVQKSYTTTAALREQSSGGIRKPLSEQAKKQLTLLSLVAALMGAVYLNWKIETDGLPIAETVSPSSPLSEVVSKSENDISLETAQTPDDAQKHYGDSLFVSADIDSADSYFAQVRLDRTQKRDEALDALALALRQATLTQAEKDSLTAELSAFTSAITLESRIENQILAKGFRNCVAFVSEQAVKIVVQPESGPLTSAHAAQITDTVISETSISPDKISIVEISR